MSETINVEHAFDPEARQAQKDMDAFLDTRPYADRADGKHHPVTGEYIDIDDEALTTGDLHTDKNHFQVARDQFEVDSMPTAYEDMTMPDLARALASAEHAADKTKSEDIQDVLADKMSEFSEKNNLDNDAQDNLWNRIMKVKDTEADQLSGGKVTKSTEAGSGDDGENNTRVENEQKISLIKQGMAQRAAKGMDSSEYDVDFEDGQDDQVLKLIAEGYGTEDLNDPRVVSSMKDWDKYEQKMTANIKTKKLLQQVAEGRQSGEWTSADDEKAFLDFLEEVKNVFGTDSLDDPRIINTLNRATEILEKEASSLNTEKADGSTEADSERSLQEELAAIPDKEADIAVDHAAELTAISEKYLAKPAQGFRLKKEYVERMVTGGSSADEALNLLLGASASDIESIARMQAKDAGIENPSQKQIVAYREHFADFMRGELEKLQVPEAAAAEKTTVVTATKESWKSRLSDRFKKMYVNVQTLPEYFKDSEKGRKRTYVAAGLGVLALGVGTYGLMKYGIGIGGTETAGASGSGRSLTDAEKLVQNNPKAFERMIKWYNTQKQLNPNANASTLAKGFNKYLQVTGK